MQQAIAVENLSKRFLLGTSNERFYRTLRDSIARLAHRLSQSQPDDLKEIWALRDVSFEIEEGTAVGIIGRNGAGKSTLLKILSRITEPTSGRARLRGRVASLLEVGTGFHPELTGRENIHLAGAVLGMSRAEIARDFDAIVAFSEMERFLDTPVKRYSSGMYVRLAFAVAAHLTPEILIVDEVLAVGDIEFQRRCLGRMGAVARSGRTVLLVSHNMRSVEDLCTRSILLNKGTIEANGPTADVVARYLTTGSGGWLWDVASLPDREGTGEVRITRLELFGEDGLPTETVEFCRPFTVRIHFEAVAPIENAGFALALLTERDERVFQTMTMEENVVIESLVGAGHVDCRVRTPNVLPGTYSLEVEVAAIGRRTLDRLRRVGRVEIGIGNWREARIGKLTRRERGPVYLKCDWQVNAGAVSERASA